MSRFAWPASGSDQMLADDVRNRFVTEFNREIESWEVRARKAGYSDTQIESEIRRMNMLKERALSEGDSAFWLRHRRDSARMICKAVESRSIHPRKQHVPRFDFSYS